MNHLKAVRRRISLPGLALIMIALPACQSARPWSGDPTGVSSRVAYRPVQTSLRGRTFYVSGYWPARGPHIAGQVARRPRAPVDAVPAYVTPAPAAAPPAVTIRQGTWDEP